MRLLQRKGNGRFELTKDLADDDLPRYAILSHTWLADDEEVTFEDLASGHGTDKCGYNKITFCGEQAAKDDLDYFWVDTCCIRKESSAELQEAITSMYSWYRKAEKCYVYLTDVSAGTPDGFVAEKKDRSAARPWESAFRHSKWFTRGWTLQELLAPPSVEFFSAEGIRLGDKSSLEECLHEITGIPHQALRGDDMANFSVAERFSWTEDRITKRKEDKAYCLLGIFQVSMSVRYGEGGESAIARLREKVDKKHAENAKLDQLLSTLPCAAEAAFNSHSNQHSPTCLPSTRGELLQDIEQWADAYDDRCIYWLSGIAGTGKSTIARTVARTYYDRGNLGASFLFSKGGGDLSNANVLVTTLARQLANRVPSAKPYICDAIRGQEDIIGHSLQDQWKHLIIGPLSKLKGNSSPSIVVLVIDALDECDSEGDIRAILKFLVTARSLRRVRLKIFITSRPEIPIRVSMSKLSEEESRVFILQEIPQTLIDRDLGLFFAKSFSTIREERGFEPDDWPGMTYIKQLVKISSGLFIWASIACRYVRDGKQLAMKRITGLIKGPLSGTNNPQKQLDQLYTTVLRESIPQGCNPEDRAELHNTLREVLGSIVILFSPLPENSLAELLDTDPNRIKATLADLHTILHIPSNASQPIRPHHPTFRDFLINKDRCSDVNFLVDEKRTHQALADNCVKVMSKMLKRDICGLTLPGTLVEDIDPDLRNRCIPPALRYACLYWVQHYRQSGMPLADGDYVHCFLQQHFLHWLEVVNLMGQSSAIGAILRMYHALLQPPVNERQIPWVKDARRFFFAFQSIIKQAPLQTYCSALTFIPPTNELKRHFSRQRHPWILRFKMAEADVPMAKDEFNYVNDLAFTPDGKQIASGSNIQAARLWDVDRKAALRTFGGLRDKVSSVTISPDGRTIAAGSDDFTVVAWDIRTGTLRYALAAHTGWVNSVVFSQDGKLLVSGSMDETVAIWDAATGRELRRINNQSSCVNSAAFSPNGLLVAAASVDEVIRLWDISKDTEELRTMFDGHSGPVNSVRFSPTGQRIVSGSDDMTIRLWDSVTGTELSTLKGHTKKVMAVTYSLDGRLIVSGSEDMSVRIWDAPSGVPLHILRDHTSGINAVTFSPNGQLLASCSFDDEVRLWNTKTWTPRGTLDDFEDVVPTGSSTTAGSHLSDSADGDMMASIHYEPITEIETQLKGHSDTVTSLVCSPNGQLLASGSRDGLIKIWSRDGLELCKVAGHSDVVADIAFSPDNLSVASASADKTVRLWSIRTGGESYTLRGHCDKVSRVLFSPDGLLLASCSVDTTIRLWDVATGESRGRLIGHTDSVNDFAFSPDSCFIVSCSSDMTLILWDLATRTAWRTLRGHTGKVNSVAFSLDGELVVSGSDDANIRLWSKEGAAAGVIRSDSACVKSAALSADNRAVVSSATDGTVRLWNTATKLPQGCLHVGVVVKKLSFSRCCRFVETDRGLLDVALFSSPSLSDLDTPPSRAFALFVTDNWLRKDAANVLWLPDKYCATCVATGKDLVVMGHASGDISFVYV